MPKFTRRIKKYRKNKTKYNHYKKGGDGPSDETKGVFDIIGDKIGDVASSVANKAEDIGLGALGLEKVNESQNDKKVDENIEKVGNAASGVVSDVENVVDKTSGAIVNNVNEVLASNQVNEGVKAAANETAEITGKLAETFNDAMNNPQVKAEVEEAIENAGEIGTVVAKAAEEPLKEAAKVGVEAGTKALGAATSGVIKVGTDALGAIPFIGGIIDLGKMINDGTKAASTVVKAGTEVVETTSDAITETTENIKEGLKDLEEKKQMSQQIANRTTKSINQFENPLQAPTQSAGGRKTRRILFKNRAKSKRVRFAI